MTFPLIWSLLTAQPWPFHLLHLKKSKSSSKHAKHLASASEPSIARGTKQSSANDKAEQRRHKALERQFDLAQQRAQSSGLLGAPLFGPVAPGPIAAAHTFLEADQNLASGVMIPQSAGGMDATVLPAGHLLHPEAPSLPQASSARPAPEATFTPTAASLCSGEGPHSSLPLNVQSIVAETISRFLAVGALPIHPPPPSLPPSQLQVPTYMDHHQEYVG